MSTAIEDVKSLAETVASDDSMGQSIEAVDIKSEPPDEAAESTITCRIESIESKPFEDSASSDVMQIKQESDRADMFTPVVSISYDAPSIENSGRSDSEDVRSCLQEELVLKEEVDEGHFDMAPAKDSIMIELEIKTEEHSDTAVIPNDIEHNETAAANYGVDSSKALPGEPPPDRMTELHVFNPDFQLNSITGDMLSLEQEAYGLLKAKNKIKPVNKTKECPKCMKKFAGARGLAKHLKVHASIENRARGLEKGRKTKELKRIQKAEEIAKMDMATQKDIPYSYNKNAKPKKGQFKCHNCGKIYRVLRCLRRHKRSCLSEEEETTLGKRLRRPVVEPKVQEEVVKRKNGEYKCECGKIFSRRSPMETCLRSHHPEEESEVFKCATCAKTFQTKVELARHRKLQHVKKKFQCKFCPMDYHTPKELFQHLRAHKKVQMMEYKVISEVVEGKQVIRCFICNMTFAELSELKAHVSVDHREPYLCPLCKQKFPKIVDFATHTKSAHPEVEGQSVLDVLEAFSILAQAWKCEECHLQFEDPDNLVKHQREEHSSLKKLAEDESSKFLFRCEDCRRMFATLKQLSSHRDMHHTVKESVAENEVEQIAEEVVQPLPMCVHCRKVCKDEATLTSHLRLHSMDRQYPCKFCDYRFASSEKRKNHATIHTGDMKYVCFICEYRCSSENRLNMHKQMPKHLDLKEKLLNGPPYERPVTPPPVVAKKKRHSSESKKVHSPVKQIACDICAEMFTDEEIMLRHKDTHPFIVFPNEGEPKRIFFK